MNIEKATVRERERETNEKKQSRTMKIRTCSSKLAMAVQQGDSSIRMSTNSNKKKLMNV